MPEPAQVELLTGQQAQALVMRALETEGAVVESWAVHSLHHRPGAGVSVGYTLRVRAADGTVSDQYVCATTARLSRLDTPGLVRLDHPDGLISVHMWRHPHDPELPALPIACDHAAVSQILGYPVKVSMVGYRPTRRCVLKAASDESTTAFLKVVRPKALPDLVRRHRVLAEAGIPVPHVSHVDERGLVALTVAPGVPMANYLAKGLLNPVATIDAAFAVLNALPAEVMSLPRHPSWSERVEYYGHAAATALPEAANRANAVAGHVVHLMRNSDPGPLVPTHGDFYEANVFLSSDATVSALLDVDAVGPGYRVDDIACMLGHVSVLPHLAPNVYPHVPAIVETWWARVVPFVDPQALAARAAAVTLSLVAGAKKTRGDAWRADAFGRMAEAERWLSRA